jgi:hypothetical protein
MRLARHGVEARSTVGRGARGWHGTWKIAGKEVSS